MQAGHPSSGVAEGFRSDVLVRIMVHTESMVLLEFLTQVEPALLEQLISQQLGQLRGGARSLVSIMTRREQRAAKTSMYLMKPTMPRDRTSKKLN
jgi:hypothetical protein